MSELEKLCVLTSFSGWNKIPSDVPSCLFCAITSKEEEMIIYHTLKSLKTIFIVWISLKNVKIWKLRPCFTPEVTWSVLSVSTLSVSSLLRDVLFTAWEHDVWNESGMSDIATVTKGGEFLLWSADGQERVQRIFWVASWIFFLKHLERVFFVSAECSTLGKTQC